MDIWLESPVALSASPRLRGFHWITVARSTIVIVIVLNAVAALAQEPKESVPPINPTPAEDVDREIYDLEVSPADEPRPAMKYRLLPNPADLKPGNAATQYYKAFVLEAESPVRTKAFRKLEEQFETPLRKLDIEDLGQTLELLYEEPFYRSIRTATFRATCDWEEPAEEEGVSLLLPALSNFRRTALLLSMKAKYEIARGERDAAFANARDIFTLGYHLQQDGETIVQCLVGIAICGIAYDDVLREWLQSHDSPNLYWALAEVPPYFDSRRVINSDLRLLEYTIHALREVDKRPFSVEEATVLAAEAFAVGRGSRRGDSDVKRRLDLAAWAVQNYDESYQELLVANYSKDLLDKMPTLQVAVLAHWKRYQRASDDLYKWSVLAYGPDRELALRKQDEIQSNSRLSVMPFSNFLPALRAMYQAQLRQFRFISVLRAIEAMRLYAARHGKWPEALTDIHEVPVPNDPTTNSPFVYRVNGRDAVLTMVRHRLGGDLEYEYRLRLRDEPAKN